MIDNNKYNLLTQIVLIAFLGIILGYILSISFNKKKYKGTICLVIDDFGFSQSDIIKDFFHLNNNITVAIIPGTPYANILSKYADSLGIETIIHMPMESYEQDETKYPISLNEKLNSVIVQKRIESAFNEIPNALGMNNHQGSKATANLQLMKNVARSLKNLDKFFLDSFTNPESRGFITMRRYGVPTQLRQVFIDHKENEDHIKYQLDSLKQLSHTMNIAIGIGHAKPITLEILKKEIPRLESEGYKFISLSEAVH